jgi:hypothetical protein
VGRTSGETLACEARRCDGFEASLQLKSCCSHRNRTRCILGCLGAARRVAS